MISSTITIITPIDPTVAIPVILKRKEGTVKGTVKVGSVCVVVSVSVVPVLVDVV